MSIASLDELIASVRQRVSLQKTAVRTTVAAIPFGVFDVAGQPGAGTLAVGNTAAGIVPTDALAGYPAIQNFAAGTKGYLAGLEFYNTVAARLALYDTLFSAGAFAFNANVTLASQPSYAARVSDGNYNGLEIWIEAVTAFTGSQSIAVTYTNQDGATGRTTGTIATGVAPTIGRMLRLPLQAGDKGVQKIESVVSSVSTVGTFNVHVLRPLWSGRIGAANQVDSHDFMRVGLPEIFQDSALRAIVTADSTSSGLLELIATIAAG